MKPFPFRHPFFRGLLPLCSMLLVIACNNTPAGKAGPENDTTAAAKPADTQSAGSAADTSIVTVAAIRPLAGDSAELLFNERENIYVIGKQAASFKEMNNTLQTALARGTPLKIIFDHKHFTITRVDTASGRELDAFRSLRRELMSAAAPSSIDVQKIDTSLFNRTDKSLKFPVFRLCSNIVPDYATAKAIFDYCALQGCSTPGTVTITPCIPFQYVRDGCYARAHKMRAIIQARYGYCCEKVFSFANHGSDQLAVKASKWGGCCVTWWYHVAPLIRVNFSIVIHHTVIHTSLAYVIDPGMFNQPVLLSTWLQAQKETSCSATANVSTYSIQPGSAYAPANYAGTAFTTDPLLAATNITLINYRNLHTCP